MSKPILSIDFDGVIHSYSSGWQDGTLYDGVTDGFFDWAQEAAKHFRLIIYSSRSKSAQGIEEMKQWLSAHDSKWREAHGGRADIEFEFASEKPPAFLTIDDRALTFTGNWLDFSPEILLKFKPWNKQ